MTNQIKIDWTKPLRFDGPDYRPELDEIRLRGQIKDIFNLMRDNKWRTLTDIQWILGYPQASISAQLRHLRKARFGAHVVEKRRKRGGLFEYRLVVNERNEK